MNVFTVEVDALAEHIVIVGPSLALCNVDLIIEAWVMN